MNRRQFLNRLLLTAGAAALGAAGWGFAVEPRLIRLEAVSVPLPGLPPHLDGFRIGILADLHLGSQVPRAFILRAATMLAAQRPDLTVVVGDFTSEQLSAAWVDGALEPVKGAFAVPGNWDYYNSVTQQYRSVRWLINKGLLAAPGLWLAGVISGHSHGGQIRLPFAGPLLLPPGGRKYPAGLYRAPGCQVYTSRGLGTARIPVRFLCPPEVTILTLRRG